MGFVESVVVMCLDEEDVWIGGGKKGNSVEAAWKLKSSLLGVGLCKK
jgi:hypothetical protein